MQKIIILCVVFVLLVCVTSTVAQQNLPNWKHKGKLEVVENSYIILNDSRYTVGSDLKYYALSGKYVSRYDFTEGVTVGLALNEVTREVYALWLVDAEVP